MGKKPAVFHTFYEDLGTLVRGLGARRIGRELLWQ